MAKTKIQKGVILRDLKEKIDKSKSIVFAKFSGLGVKDNEDLRNKLRSEGGEYFVAKKTLLGLALKEKGYEGIDVKGLEGQVAAIFGYNDEVMPAKVVDNFMKAVPDKMDFLGGVLEEKFISAEEVKALAKLPTKNELYAKLVGSINAPVSGFVNALAGNIRNLVYALKAIEEKKSN